MKKLSPADKLFVPYDYVFESSTFPLAVKPQFSAREPGRHSHDRFWEIVLVVAGSARHWLDKTEYPITLGNLFAVPPGISHKYCDCQNLDYYNVLVDFNALRLPLFDLIHTRGYQELFVQAPKQAHHGIGKCVPQMLDIAVLDKCSNLLNRMYKLQSSHETGYQFAMAGYFCEFLRTVCQAGEAHTAVPEDGADWNLSVKIGVLATTLARECVEPWTVQSLCRSYHLSRAVLFRLFQKYYHTSPITFLTHQRVRKAMSLLANSDLAMEDIARQCGFTNGSYFSTVFRKELGVTPNQYRRHPNMTLFVNAERPPESPK